MTYSEPLWIKSVGDIMPGISSIKSLAKGQTIPERILSGNSVFSEDIRSSLQQGDLTLGNLESAIVTDFPREEIIKAPFLLGPSEAGKMLREAGVDCLSLANNHILDHGEEVARDTITNLNIQKLDYIGDPLEGQQVVRYEKKGRKIAVGGFNLCPQGKQDEVNRLLEFVERSEDTDLTLLLVHWGWGYEHLSVPSPEQVTLGHRLVDSGADIVIGCHSHVLQPIERYSGGIIAYSLGNFLFDMWREENKRGCILELCHTRNGEITVSANGTRVEKGFVESIDKSIDGYIQNTPPSIQKNIDRAAQLKYIKHVSQIIGLYLRYGPALPRQYHRKTLSRWAGKFRTKEMISR